MININKYQQNCDHVTCHIKVDTDIDVHSDEKQPVKWRAFGHVCVCVLLCFVDPILGKSRDRIQYEKAKYNKCVCIPKRRQNGKKVTSLMAWPLWPATWVMMIAFITMKSSLVPLIEGLCAQI